MVTKTVKREVKTRFKWPAFFIGCLAILLVANSKTKFSDWWTNKVIDMHEVTFAFSVYIAWYWASWKANTYVSTMKFMLVNW